MRHIGTLGDARMAERLSAYLTVLGIANHVDKDDGQFDVWVKEEDRLDKAVAEFDAFEKNPNEEKYTKAVTDASALIEKEIERRRKVKKNVVKVSEGWPKGASRKAPLTMVLIGMSIVIAVFSGMWKRPMPEEVYRGTFFKSLAFVAVESPDAEKIDEAASGPDDLKLRWASLRRFELWRLITPVFIHFGVFHLVFNLIWLYQLGRLLEDRFGTPLFGLLVLLTAAIPNLLQGSMPIVLEGSAPNMFPGGDLLLTTFGGMSGVVYGLFGYAWIRSSLDQSSGFMIPQSTVVIMIGWMLLGFTDFDQQWLGFSMANWGHGGGLVVGMAMAYYSVLKLNRK